jgi:starch synthase (maltosyl-transferring)
MILYNLFPLLAGKFSAWKPHLERAAAMGFDWIFVNPVQQPGMSESLYSIADYFQLNPRLVDKDTTLSPEKQLKDAIQTAEKLGMQVMVDLVINHCAVDSPLAKQHPQWFVHEPDGSIAHPFCIDNGEKVVWGDLIQFDHEHTRDPEGLYQYCRKVVEHLIQLGFKGFRCDAAYQLPRALWERLITDSKKRHPDIIFAAETLGCTAQETKQTAKAGFDYIFNSSKWWDFEGSWLKEQYHLLRNIAPSIGFPESHDTERLMTESNGNTAALKQRYLFAAMFSTGVMIPIGFEFGFRNRLHVVETRPEDWEETEVDLRDFIHKVNTIKQRYPVFQEESINSFLPYQNTNILLLWKASPETSQEALIILNKDPWNRQRFYTANLHQFVQATGPLVDVSPEYPVDYLPKPFTYELNPGQGLVLVYAP